MAVRLVCPFAIESDLSLMPDTSAVSVPAPAPTVPSVETVIPDAPTADTPVVTPPVTDTSVVDTPVSGGSVSAPVVTPAPDASVSTPIPENSADPWQIALTVATCVWLGGMALLAAYAAFTTLRLRRRVGEAARLEGNLWLCDHIRSPFILGVFRPRIYLPSDLSGAARYSVVAHEQAHLHRRDHWWKPLGFLLLTVYWFNPLMWVAYVFLCRDIEAACDERVVRDMNATDRKAYSEALLLCSAPRRLVSACPLAFGETGVKSRIKSVLSYKKPTIWIIVAALFVSTVAGVCLLTDPKTDDPDPDAPAVTDEDDPDEDDTSDKTEDNIAPVGLTYVIKSGYVSGQEQEAMMGSASVKRFDTRDELETFLTTYQTSEDGRTRWKISEFDQYDTAFFAENALLLTFRQTSSGMYTPQVGGYTYSEDGTTLSVAVDELQPGGMVTMDIGHWMLFSGIRKADLDGVTKLTSYLGQEILTSYYWMTYSHPVAVGDEGDVAFGRYHIYDASFETLLPLVEGLEWYGADTMADTDFTAIACFTFDGEKKYYFSLNDKQLYDGEQIADLTAEEYEKLDYYLREGNPGEDAATASVTGTVAEWNKEDGYLVLEVTDGDSKLGSRVTVYTGILPPGSGPAVGYSATIYYDGWCDDNVIYAINRKWQDADLLGGPDDEPTTGSATSTTKPTTAKPTAPAKVTFVEFSRPNTSPYLHEPYYLTQYMSPIQPDAATCEWLRTFASRTGWFKKDTYVGAYDAYFTIGEDENYYYIDRVNQVIHHNRRFLSLTKEELSKLDALIRGCDLMQYSPTIVGTTMDWEAITGTMQEHVKGEDGYILLKVDSQFTDRFGETVKVSTRFIPQPSISSAKSALCVVYDGEYVGDPGSTDMKTIYAHEINMLSEDAIISTGVPLYDDLLEQIQTYFYDRSALAPDCSAQIFESNSALSGVGIRLIDLDNEGQKELVIADSGVSMWNTGVLYDVYTIQNNRLVHVLCSTDFRDYSICRGFYIAEYRLESMLKWREKYYRIDNGQLVFLDGVAFGVKHAESVGIPSEDAWFRIVVQDGVETYEPITEEQSKEISHTYNDGDVTFRIDGIPFSL